MKKDNMWLFFFLHPIQLIGFGGQFECYFDHLKGFI